MKIFLAERTDEERGCRVYLTFELSVWSINILCGKHGCVISCFRFPNGG